jgi:hypothetical protein
MDDEAASIDEQLEQLTRLKPDPDKAKPTGIFARDGRTFWKSKNDSGSEFRLVEPGLWIQSAVGGTRERYEFTEVARTPEYVEIYDKSRGFAKRLRVGHADVDLAYKPGTSSEFSQWAAGNWFTDSPDVIYLADLDETTFKVWDYLDDKQSGWSNDGRIEDARIFLDNRPAVKGLLTCPPANDFASVKYDIVKHHRQVFRARVGIADWKRKNPETPLTFIVLGDGKKLFESEPVKEWKDVQDCEVKIRGVKELELRVDCPGPSENAYAVWFEPRLSLK